MSINLAIAIIVVLAVVGIALALLRKFLPAVVLILLTAATAVVVGLDPLDVIHI